MTATSTAIVPTDHAGRYLQQLCKHWSHKLEVTYTAQAGSVVFPRDVRGADWPGDATLTLHADAGALECTITASTTAQLDSLKETVASHLDRFAFREAPLTFAWSAA